MRLLRIIGLLSVLSIAGVVVGIGLYPYRQRIVERLTRQEVSVTIPEGTTAAGIDRRMAQAGVVPAGSIMRLAEEQGREGYLFPDTYRLYKNSDPQRVVDLMVATFNRKAGPLLEGDLEHARDRVVIASLLEREVPNHDERRIVAGIITKRAQAGKPLQIDATLCYIKEVRAQNPDEPCHPITRLDLAIDSPYNTYLYQGLPPGPIGNPGLDALRAARESVPSPYWFYLSDPATGRTIFSSTGEEHEKNRHRYLSDG